MERLLCVFVPALADESPDGATLRTYLALLDALGLLCPFTEPVRLGLYAMPTRGPSRFFGGEAAVLDAVAAAVGDVARAEARLGVADGLFGAELAARRAVVVPVGATDAFRRALPLDALGAATWPPPAGASGCTPSGPSPTWRRRAWPSASTATRCVLHRWRAAWWASSRASATRAWPRAWRACAARPGRTPSSADSSASRGAGDDRAEAAAAPRARAPGRRRGVRRVGSRGGRAPEDRASLVPWGSAGPAPRRRALARPAPRPAAGDDAGALRAGRPARRRRRRASRVSGRGLLSADPASVGFSSRARAGVAWHAGPWPIVERWWASPRRRAHLQVLLDDRRGGAAAWPSRSRWWLSGVYD